MQSVCKRLEMSLSLQIFRDEGVKRELLALACPLEMLQEQVRGTGISLPFGAHSGAPAKGKHKTHVLTPQNQGGGFCWIFILTLLLRGWVG